MPELTHQPTLADLQAYIKALCAERGWDKNNHLEIFLLFSEEVGELARAIRDRTELSPEVGQEANKRALEDEFADVLNYLLDLANYFDVDLEAAFRRKNAANESREWD